LVIPVFVISYGLFVKNVFPTKIWLCGKSPLVMGKFAISIYWTAPYALGFKCIVMRERGLLLVSGVWTSPQNFLYYHKCKRPGIGTDSII
jgi:hypothetical protein